MKTEIGETAVCNLGSVNLVNHLHEIYSKDGSLKSVDICFTKLKGTISIAIRMLDNVIDLNFYPTEEAKHSNLKNRPIGLGLMGLHDVLHRMNIPIDSDEAINFNERLFQEYSHSAILASSLLAKDRGVYETYEGSLWSQNIFPIDSWKTLMKYRNKRATTPALHDYEDVRQSVKDHGMRNSNVMAIAPTATIGYINGVEQSIEPNFSVLFVYENKSGNSYIINEHFVNDMKKEGLWSPEAASLIKSVDGDLSRLNGDIPAWMKEKYKTAFDRDMFKLIECNASRQKWMDQSISFNLYNKTTSLKYLNDLYMACWEAGLKTTYYLRNRAASKVEKSTEKMTSETSETTEKSPEQTSCSLESMANGDICESCQ